MAHIYKPTYTVTIPASAEKYNSNGVNCVRWVGRGGRKMSGVVCEGKPGRCLVESVNWYVSYTDHAGDERRVPGYPDKAATAALMSQLTRTASRVSAGILPPEAARVKLTLTDLVAKWVGYLSNAGDCEKHTRTQRYRAARVVEGIGATLAADITPAAVMKWIGEEKSRNPRFGGATAGHYVGSIKAFTRWLSTVEKCEPTDHLSALIRTTDHTDPRYERRAISAEEFRKLVAHVFKSPTVLFTLSGSERAVLYLVAAGTGLRCGELSSLTPGSFSLDSSPPTVTVAAAYSKNRRRDVLPLAGELVEDVRPLLALRTVNQKVWPDRSRTTTNRWHDRGAEMLAHDLRAAGLPVADADGRVFDFHSLRSQYATDLERSGVPLGRAQKLLRHSTPVLTAKHYTRPELSELAEDVERMQKGRAKGKGGKR